MSSRVWSFAKCQEGQGLLEYALVMGLIVVVALGAVPWLGQNLTDVFSRAAQILHP
jgi:Flp pilus assembly pilin Flp